jgi:large subunit ribosomal protein L21
MASNNNTYAIIETAGKQYKVRPGDVILAELGGEETTLNFNVLAIGGENAKIGTPFVEGVSVKGTVMDVVKGPKVRVSTFKAKSNYHRVIGYRSVFKKIRIDEIV